MEKTGSETGFRRGLTGFKKRDLKRDLKRGLWVVGSLLCPAGRYAARSSATRLTAIFRYVLPLGRAHPYIYIVEGRPVVHVGRRGSIVAVQGTNAGLNTIGSIAEGSEGAETRSRGSTHSLPKTVAKILIFVVTAKSKSDFFKIYLARPGKVGALKRPVCLVCRCFHRGT